MAKSIPLHPEKKMTDDQSMTVEDSDPVAGTMDDLNLERMPNPLYSDRMDLFFFFS
jgi:hypothetical protein